ncbi:glyoxylase-like metal-dependent hydrolase (beta-lactamase superfamily II) [Paenibacillus castaneae]|uniref:MBL fold metallo-hydrolase n=1 Tax=Paenibacillus castaneae TaxID=474957 RepID=UPI000C9AF1D4|nr:MBL fold metallo-hydrolase [Paenibacillus castaneae]NIK78862.1 glyoxylase-like metal-dependent hydrolase (beta-lactamase superfamily II) [Paenibacillus castaneae]
MESNMGVMPIVLELNAGSFVVHAALFWDEKDVILVDTGIPGHGKLIKETLNRESNLFDRLTKIIITHHDNDHIGSLPELLAESNNRIEVLAHPLAKPYIMGELPLMKGGHMARPAKVDYTVQDGEVLPYCGGIQVVYTPGHMPDHISLYHLPSKTLISGDALTAQEGVLMPPSAQFTIDMDQALQSVAKLAELDIETVIAYHGGVCKDQIRERLAVIAEGAGRT